MYYAETEQRVVFLSYDEREYCVLGAGWFDEELSTVINMSILLEYALTCRSWAGGEEALYRCAGIWKTSLSRLQEQLESDCLPLDNSPTSVSHILKHIFETVDCHPSVENVDTASSIVITDYPLEKAAKRSGLRREYC